MKPYTGAAGVYVCHCWGGRWGDMVAAVCTGARTDRFVWLDVFAVSNSTACGHLKWPPASASSWVLCATVAAMLRGYQRLAAPPGLPQGLSSLLARK